ncbi:nuclear envelope integral membrane protein 2 [Rhynchocyon petersi]
MRPPPGLPWLLLWLTPWAALSAGEARGDAAEATLSGNAAAGPPLAPTAGAAGGRRARPPAWGWLACGRAHPPAWGRSAGVRAGASPGVGPVGRRAGGRVPRRGAGRPACGRARSAAWSLGPGRPVPARAPFVPARASFSGAFSPLQCWELTLWTRFRRRSPSHSRSAHFPPNFERRASPPETQKQWAFSRCKVLKEMDLMESSKLECYCYYKNTQMKWHSMWSTVQVKVTSPGLFSIIYITEIHNCRYPETITSFIKCVIHNFWTPKESNNITITINPYGETVCFSVQPARKIFMYTVTVTQNVVDFKLFLVFVAGVGLFFYAKSLSQSHLFYYFSGTVLGVLMTLVFVLLLMKRFIPKYSTFWALMVGSWFASVYILSQLVEDLKWLWYGSRVYLLGYALVVGFFSFAICYKHGPFVDERSRSLLRWALQLLSLVLIYCGVSIPQCAYVVIILILCSRLLHYPLKVFCSLSRKMKRWFTSEKLVVKLLTEEEYREQADAETASALEELRRVCARPDFPSWLAVSRLQAPKKFADFVLGASHLSPEEIHLHEEQYGLGGVFLEEQLFNPTTT